MGDAHAFERQRRDPEFERSRCGERRGKGYEPSRVRRPLQREQRPPLQRQIEQEAPHDRIDAKERHPADVQVPVGRRGEAPQRYDDEHEQDREGDLDAPVATAKRAARKEQ